LIYRLLENRLDQYGTHHTTEDVLTTLRNMNVVNMNDMYYMAAYTKSKVCTALNAIYGTRLDNKNHAPKDLHKIIKEITK